MATPAYFSTIEVDDDGVSTSRWSGRWYDIKIQDYVTTGNPLDFDEDGSTS